MKRVPRWLKNRERNLRKRISQSMRDAGYPNGKCRPLQRRWNRVRQLQKALRGL